MAKLEVGTKGLVSMRVDYRRDDVSYEMASIVRVHRTWAEFVTDNTRTPGWIKLDGDDGSYEAYYGETRPTASKIAHSNDGSFRTDIDAAIGEQIWAQLGRVRSLFLPPKHLTRVQLEQIRDLLLPPAGTTTEETP